MGPIVETRNGTVQGVERDGVRAFMGIPFAQPPVGSLRWSAPRPPSGWAGVRDASRPGPAAPQSPSPMDAVATARVLQTSEDCLTVNVWAPVGDPTPRPVLVWIHGGGLLLGWGADPVYDGTILARRGGVVVVTFNYRLGALGVLAHPALADPGSGAIGNYGLLDQIAALEWVRDEIGAFGGDPANVTIFGESAGGMSVGALLGTPRARGLFRRAISQSGGARAMPLENMIEITERFARELGIESGHLTRLREVPVEQIVDAQRRMRLVATTSRGGGFTVDGTLLPVAPLDAIRGGCSEGIGLIAGTTRDESKLFLAVRGVGPDDYPQTTDENLPDHIDRILAQAGVTGEDRAEGLIETFREARAARGEPRSALELRLAIETELFARRLCLQMLEAQEAHSPGTYGYLFTWESKALGGLLGACHGIDIPFVFGNFGAERFTGPIQVPDRELSGRVQGAWASFARGGDPSCPGIGEWPRYDAGRRATMALGLRCEVVNAPNEQERVACKNALAGTPVG